MEMNYDKKNGDVCFRESDHAYFNEKNPEIKYTSVTTLIGKYHEPFNAQFWAVYKVLEEMLDRSLFLTFKDRYFKKKELDRKWLEEFNVNEADFDRLVEEKLLSYKKAGEEGCARGSAYHLKKELEFYECEEHDLKKFVPNCEGKFSCQKHNWDLSRERAVIPEFLVYYHSPELNIAGQLDLLIKDGNDIYILDYKTNAKGIKDKPIYDSINKKFKTMYYPLNNLNDTTLVHYTLQLSLYAWMLQQINPEYNIKLLKLLHIDGNNVETDYELPYIKSDIERLIKYHKKVLANECRKNR